MSALVLLLLAQVVTPVQVTNTKTSNAAATRCVNAAGTAFESCGGSGGGSTYVNALIDGGTISVNNFPASQPVTGPLTDAQLRATPVPVSGSVTATGPLTDTQLRATPVPVSGPLTDTQLRATPVPVSGTVTTGGLTDTQLRATPVPVSGTVTAANASVGATGAAPPSSATLSGGSVTTAAPTYTAGQMAGLSLDLAGNLRVATSVAALFQTIAISAAGNTGTISQALSLGNILVPWTGARTGPAVLTIPTAANSGNELVVYDQANNAGAFPITVTPVSGSVVGVPVLSRNRGTIRLLDSAGGFGWVVIE
jgi:hypothetical protein